MSGVFGIETIDEIEDALSDFILDSVDNYISQYSVDGEIQQNRGENAIESEFEYLQNKGGSFFDTKLSSKSDIDYEDFYKSDLDSPYYNNDIKVLVEGVKSKSVKQKETRRDIFRETKLHQRERESIKERDGEIFFGMLIGLGIAYRILMRRNNDEW